MLLGREFWIAFGLTPTAVEVIDAKALLESIGVLVGPHDGRGTFERCIVSDEAFKKLDPLWGSRFIWGS